jgi:ATP-dependent DNA ligase
MPFDLLYLEGFDLRKAALIERKRILKSLYDETGLSAPVLYSEHLETDGAGMFEAARRMSLEGIVSKRVDAPYRSGDRNDSWQKIETIRDKFQIVGFIPEAGGIAALYLGKREGKGTEICRQGRHWLHHGGVGLPATAPGCAGDAAAAADDEGAEVESQVGRAGVDRGCRISRHHPRGALAT